MTPLPELARAHWIWPGTLYDDPVNVYAHFHRVVDVDRVPPSVVTHITADAEYQLYVNGHYAARGPARGYQPHWPVDEVDIAQFLRTGGNVIAIIAHNPGVGTFRYRSESYAGVMVSMAIGDTRLVSDRSWRCRIDPSRARTTPKLSKQMGFQEQVDLRFDDRAWMTAPEASLGADWRVPSARPYGSAPWHATEPRGLPMLTRRQMPYAREVARAAFAEPGRGDTHAMTRPTSLHRRQIEAAEWTASDSSAIENGMLCVGVPEIEAGHARAITLDLGRASIGELLVEARGSTGGELLDVLFTEDITQHGCPVFAGDASDGHIDMATRVVLGCGMRGPCAHEAFQVIGHRYATMVVSGPAPAIALRVAHRETRCPIDVVGSFQCDDATLNDIYRISENTQRNCMMDAYVDTPWREQAQWWGDARVQAWNTFALANDPRLLRRGLRQIADPAQEVPNGLTYGHAPTIAHDCILPDFTCVWMLTIWDDYFHSGDPCMFAELWPR
ncbi:MAG: alpha-L-rhamnosidase, partial [Planctomycetota bacterium]